MKIKDKQDFKTKPKPVALTTGDTVQKAIDIMCENNIGSIVIVNADQTVAGIVTERDMVLRVLGQKIAPETTPLSQVMSRNVHVANENDDVVDWMQTMSKERFRRLPVVDVQGKLVNMMSQGDFVAYTWPDLYEKVKRDLKDRLGKSLQLLLIIFAIITLSLIALKL